MTAVPRIGVIAAGGQGQRIRPLSSSTPKVLLEVGGKAILTRQLELMRDILCISKILLVVNYRAAELRRIYGTGFDVGIQITYIDNESSQGGLGTVLTAVEPYVQEPFVLLLGDELYLETNHAALTMVSEPYVAICGIQRTDDMEVIRKNYSVTLRDGLITSLVEKPVIAPTPFVGCGTYLLDPEIFRDGRETAVSRRTGQLELTDILNHAAQRGARVLPFTISGKYMNINTIEDLQAANELCDRCCSCHSTPQAVPEPVMPMGPIE